MKIQSIGIRIIIKKIILLFNILFLLFAYTSCTQSHTSSDLHPWISKKKGISLLILGNVQDGGSPHIGCKKSCCRTLFDQSINTRMVTSLGLIDHDHDNQYLFEAGPDAPRQIKQLLEYASDTLKKTPDGIFLTHAHIYPRQIGWSIILG